MVAFNGQASSWESVPSGVSPIFFLINVNDLPDGIQSLCKKFPDDTFLFSKCQHFKKPKRQLYEDLIVIKKGVF